MPHKVLMEPEGQVLSCLYSFMEYTLYTVETGLLAYVLLGSIAELSTLIFENAPIMQSF